MSAPSSKAVATVQGGAIHAEIEIAAPPEAVFRALTTPAELMTWWGSPEMYTHDAWEVYLRVGGKWKSMGRGADHHTFSVEGEYLEIDPPRLLVHTWRASFDDLQTTVVRYDLAPPRNRHAPDAHPQRIRYTRRVRQESRHRLALGVGLAGGPCHPVRRPRRDPFPEPRMKPVLWLRFSAGLYAFFTLGHGYGGNFAPGQGAEEDALFATMRAYKFPVQGFMRSHWEMLRGFSHITTAMLVLMMVLTWQLGTLSKTQPQAARPLVFTALLASAGLAILGWVWFFTAPAATATLATVCLAIAWVRLGTA
jgi:uncharacterized protein YndB with AHSA1/START domain